MKRILFASTLAGAAASATALAAQGGLPSGFPATWRTTARTPPQIAQSAGVLMGVEPAGPGALTIHTVDVLKAGRQIGYVEKQFRQHRTKGGSVTCGGKQYHGPYTMDLRGRSGGGWFGFVALPGAIQLTITHEIEVASTPAGPPSCREDSGTWVGNIPPLAGKSGTWSESARGVFVLD